MHPEFFLALDTETGGIGNDKSLLSAYFLILDKNLTPVDELLLHTRPDNGIYSVTAEALKINGINLVDHDSKAVCYKKAGTELYAFLTKHNPLGKFKFIPIGHNVSFDIKFVQEILLAESTWNKFVSYRTIDTGIVAQFLRLTSILPQNLSGSLSELAKHYGVYNQIAHTADGDVKMTVEVLKAMRESIP